MLKSIFRISLVLFSLTIAVGKAEAFPWVVQHGYTTCMTCHYSPSGAGALTNYGKFIGGELFGRYNDSSTALPWLRNPTVEDKFEKKFFSTNVDWIFGTQGRAVQSYFDTPTRRYGNAKLMQLDVETGFSLEEFFTVIQWGFKGAIANTAADEKPSDLQVRQYYAGMRNVNYAFRVGKFFPEFGIRHPNHNIPTRQGSFFGPNQEPLLIQYSRYLDQGDINIGYLKGEETPKLKGVSLAEKQGLVGTLTYRTGHSRSGLSMLNVAKGDDKVEATSAFTALGYAEKGYTLAEYTHISQSTGGQAPFDERNLTFLETGWEATKGLFCYLGYENTELVTAKSSSTMIPLGLRFYPYTHFELNGMLAKMYAGSADYGTAAFLMTHWYF